MTHRIGGLEADCWYHGEISRENAAYLVMSAGNPDGCFLVRDSSGFPDSFALTMWANNTVHHFLIVCHGDGWYSVDKGPRFPGLDGLVEHYHVTAYELPTKLSTFVPGRPPPLSSRWVFTALHKAVASQNTSAVVKLLSGVQSYITETVDSTNAMGQTPVHEASKRGYLDILKLLLDKKPDLSIGDSKGSTALQLAARYGHAEAIRLLVEVGKADVQNRNAATGWVALHEAAFRGHIECCKVLLELNAPLRPRTPAPNRDTPCDLALRFRQNHIVELFEWCYANYPAPRTTTAEWLYMGLNRSQAENMLRKKGQVDGSFLIRSHSRKRGCYVLSLNYNQTFCHYEIMCESDQWYYIGSGPLFNSLPSCIDHYMMHADGLETILRYPITPSGALPSNSQQKLPTPGTLLFSSDHSCPLFTSQSNQSWSSLPPPMSHPFRLPPLRPPISPHTHKGGPPEIPSRHHSVPPLIPTSSPSSVHDQDYFQAVYTCTNEGALNFGGENSDGKLRPVARGIHGTSKGPVVDSAVRTSPADAKGHGKKNAQADVSNRAKLTTQQEVEEWVTKFRSLKVVSLEETLDT